MKNKRVAIAIVKSTLMKVGEGESIDEMSALIIHRLQLGGFIVDTNIDIEKAIKSLGNAIDEADNASEFVHVLAKKGFVICAAGKILTEVDEEAMRAAHELAAWLQADDVETQPETPLEKPRRASVGQGGLAAGDNPDDLLEQ